MSFQSPEQKNYPNAYEQFNSNQSSGGQLFGAGGQPVGFEQGYPASPQPGKGLALAALVLGILAFLSGWLLVGGVLGLVGLVLAVIALRKKSGKGLAITGLVLSILGMISSALVLVMVLALWPHIAQALDTCQVHVESNNQAAFQTCFENELNSSVLGENSGSDSESSKDQDSQDA